MSPNCRGGAADGTLDWVRLIDTSELKLKLAGSVVAISSIHLLQISLQAADYTDPDIRWTLWLHGLLLAGVLVAAIAIRIKGRTPGTGTTPEALPPED